jgi:hypothetical protein
MINAYLDGGSGSTMEQIIMKQAYGDIVRLTAERDEARREVRDIIQRKEAQMLSIIEEGNGVARVLDCYKEDGNA